MTAALPRELSAICAWCRRIRDPLDDRWVLAEALPSVGAPTHAICPECYSAVTREVWTKATGAVGD